MKTAFTFLFFGLFSLAVTAQANLLQDGTTVFEGTDKDFIFSLDLSGYHGSTAIHNGFIDKFVFGGNIGENDKNRVNDRLTTMNELGADASADLQIIFNSRKSKWAWQIGLGYQVTETTEFDRDLFTLIFEGNAGFSDQPVYISESFSAYNVYNKLKFGLVDTLSGSSVSLGLYNGQSYHNMRVGRSRLTTTYEEFQNEVYASSIDIFTSGISETTDDSNKGLFKNGLGLGLDVNYNHKVSFGTFGISVIDFGVMRWNRLERKGTIGNIGYEGFELGFSEDASFPGLSNNFADSIMDQRYSGVYRYELLPTLFRLSYIAPGKEDIFLNGAISYQPHLYRIPAATIGGNYRLAEKNIIWVNASVGGMEKYGIGAGAQFQVLPNSFLRLSTRHANGWVSENELARSVHFQFVQRL